MAAGTRESGPGAEVETRSPYRGDTSIRIPVLALAAAFLAGVAAHAAERNAPDRPTKRLIEFGWDEPDTAFLRQHTAALERSPFDGCVFHAVSVSPQGARENFAWLGWGKRDFSESDLARALEDLKAIAWRRFTHNFLRFNTTPADLDWFDDHAAVRQNARLAARIARAGRCAGILFDVEEYQGRLFTYSRQRDAATRSWPDYAAQARRRGTEVMTAFRDGFPDLTVFLTFGPSLPYIRSQAGKKPLSECDYGLLAPFVDGMIAVAGGTARIVDGFELSYGYREKARFDRAYRLIKDDALPILSEPRAYERVVSAGFGLWMDYDWRTYGWDANDPGRNYFTPELFEASLRWALERTDQYVWIYTETPRWWSERETPVKLPEAYESAIRRVRNDLKLD
jgi:hypothetical protein